MSKITNLLIFLIPFQIYISISDAPLGVVFVPIILIGSLALMLTIFDDKMKLDTPIVFFVIVLILSSTLSINQYVAFRKSFVIVVSFLLYVQVIYFIRDKKSLTKLINTLKYSSIFVGIIGFFMAISFMLLPTFKIIWFNFILVYGDFLYGESFMETINGFDINNLGFYSRGYEGWFNTENLVRNVAVFKLHYEFGIYSSIFLIIFFIKYIVTKELKYFGVSLLFLVNIMSTLSRTVFFAIFVTIIYLIYLLAKEYTLSSAQKGKMKYFFILIFIVSIFVAGNPVISFFEGIYKTIVNPNQTDLYFRIDVATISIQEILNNPIFGLGRGVLEYSELGTFTKGYSAHYGPIIMLTDLGILGLLATITIFWYYFKRTSLLLKYDIESREETIFLHVFNLFLPCAFIFVNYFNSSKLLPIIFVLYAITDIKHKNLINRKNLCQ